MTLDPSRDAQVQRSSGDNGRRPGDDAAPLLIQCIDIVKSFGGVRALRGVNFDLRSGEVHALLGQNGAGKSTLIKIISGVLQKDAGTIRIDGQEVDLRNPAASRAAGIAVVYQDLSLVPSMTIADNLFLGREPHGPLGLVKSRLMQREARRFFDEHDLPLDPKSLVSDLPFAYRQLTEIAKALMGDVKILVLDEPTSALSEGEEQVLFDAIDRVTKAGVGVIYVTHRLTEVFRAAHRVTVFRDGANAATFLTQDTDMPSLVAAIVGKASQQAKLMSIAGLGPHGERAVPPDQLVLRPDEEERARAAHYTVAVVLHTTQSDWSRQQLSGIVTTLGKYSAAVVDVVDCDFQADEQVAALDRLIQRRPDAIISIPLDSARTAEAHRRVTHAGITLVLMDNAPTPLRAGTDYACVVSADNFGLGEVAAKMLAPQIPDGGSVGVVGYAADFFATSEREIAFRKWMKEHRQDVVLRSAKFTDVGDADRAAEALLQAEPDLRGVFVVWDEPAMRVVGALRRLGVDLPVTTIDLGNEVAVELASGGLVKGVGAQQPYDQGEAEARAAILALLGRELPPWVALPAVQVSELNVMEAYQAVWHTPASPELIKARQVGRSRIARADELAAGAESTQIGASGVPLLELRAVKNDRLRGVDLEVDPGELVGLAGMVGSGRTEILETVFGLRRVTSGQLLFRGEPVTLRGPRDAISIGIGLAPEDRFVQGLVIDETIEQNIALPRLSQLARFGIFRRQASQARSEGAMRELSIVAPGVDTRVGDLSGGNQQKVVFAKWRDPLPSILLLDEPSQGVDVGAREQIYDVIRSAAAAGSGVLVVSSELGELLLICDRIGFVVDGRVVREMRRTDIDSDEHLHRLVQEMQP